MKENIGFFEKNGYFIIEDAFTLEECNKLTELSNKHVKNSELIPIMNIHNYSKEIFI